VKRVLIVDDSTIMRKMMKHIVTKNGHDVVGEAVNGRLGVELYMELEPDIVTMDYVMDEMDGLEALSCIIGINPDANVIMVSSMGQDLVVRDAIILGAKNFLLKPFDEKQVVTAFNKL
jgi:two-component system chemotaxis response regulator CheY